MDKDRLELDLKASHFNDALYYSNYDDPICRALKEQYRAENPEEHMTGLEFTDSDGRNYYNHDNYTEDMFNEDMQKAEAEGFGETWIRRIILHKTDPPKAKK